MHSVHDPNRTMPELRALLQTLIEKGGSDLHLVPGSRPRIRIDGRLVSLENPPLTPSEITQLLDEILTDSQKPLWQERAEWDCALSLEGVGRFRCSLYRQRGATAAAIRMISPQIPSFEELGLPLIIGELVKKPRGLVLVTGPTGSGKSTTLSAMVEKINQERDLHILTIEDPVEFLHTNKKSLINQREVGTDTKDFHTALKSVLRQDPDVVLLGEMRDLETIQAALTLAETGHLTFATLHTNSCVQTIHRLVNVHPPHQHSQVRAQLSMVLEGILSQALVPALKGTGQALALEILIPTPAIRNLIRDDKIHQIYSMMQTGQAKHGMQTMNQSLFELYKRGQISEKAALALSSLPDELAGMIKRGGGSPILQSTASRSPSM